MNAQTIISEIKNLPHGEREKMFAWRLRATMTGGNSVLKKQNTTTVFAIKKSRGKGRK